MNNERYVFVPSYSLEPFKATSYNAIFVKSENNTSLKSIQEVNRQNKSRIGKTKQDNSIIRKHHNFTISDNAYRTLKRRINWLYYLAKSKTKKTSKGTEIYNFKIGFITLTLPSKQKHCTQEITSKMFNQFLTELRQDFNLENYVWRLEFQKNGNVHYHIVTDIFVDYEVIKRKWNRILYTNGYITDYQRKFSPMSLKDYFDYSSKFKAVDFNEIKKSYFKAKACNWSQPPTVDVKSVVSNKKISNYIAKYFSKDASNEVIKNELDNDENSKDLRLWFCSRSLSKLKSISGFCEELEVDLFSLISSCSKLKKHFAKYATSFFFNFVDFPKWSRMIIEKILRDYAKFHSYIPAT